MNFKLFLETTPDPYDPETFLVYADWLDDQDQTQYTNYMREVAYGILAMKNNDPKQAINHFKKAKNLLPRELVPDTVWNWLTTSREFFLRGLITKVLNQVLDVTQNKLPRTYVQIRHIVQDVLAYSTNIMPHNLELKHQLANVPNLMRHTRNPKMENLVDKVVDIYNLWITNPY